MKLVAFSVENYRSITKARKIPLSDYSLLLGANNEGKSNILHALTLAMDALTNWQYIVRRAGDARSVQISSSSIGRVTRVGYDWEIDFPVGKQKSAGDGKTKIILEFSLDEIEIASFREEIKSSLNGTLPIVVSLGRNSFDLSVQKPGRGHDALNRKSARIAVFVSKRIRFEYIPAIRTADSASRVISQLVDKALRSLDDNPDYERTLDKIDELQRPIFDALAGTIQGTVSNFLPNVKSVRLDARRDARHRALRRDVEIWINDGHETKLERKGDGVQSLVALALMRYASEQSKSNSSTVIAIEEPESHLHPSAVHELREVIEALSSNNQIVLTSHSPLFVNVNNLKNTVIVKSSKAECARKVSDIREALGVRFSDNLYNASVVILCEGPDDARSLRSIICANNIDIKEYLERGLIAIDYLHGASGLSQKASFYKSSACKIRCFLDNDAEGRAAVARALRSKVLKESEINTCYIPNMDESELEDLYDSRVYREDFLKEFGVDILKKTSKKQNAKWSLHVERIFKESGKPWSEETKWRVKEWMAQFAVQNADRIVRQETSEPLRNFIEGIRLALAD